MSRNHKIGNHRIVLVISVVVMTIVVLFTYLVVNRQMTIPFLYRVKSGNYYTIATVWSDSPMSVDTSNMRPLNWESFHQHPTCVFMADPFIVRDGDNFYIFYEEMPAKMNSTWGDISVLYSKNLLDWERIGVALDEPFHLSFPNVFKYKDEWYMIPETSAINEIRLYKATDFPLKWVYDATLIPDYCGVDPAIVHKDGVWYLICNSSDGLQLFFPRHLLGIMLSTQTLPYVLACKKHVQLDRFLV